MPGGFLHNATALFRLMIWRAPPGYLRISESSPNTIFVPRDVYHQSRLNTGSYSR